MRNKEEVRILTKKSLGTMIERLGRDGFAVFAPRAAGGVIDWGEVDSISDIRPGLGTIESPGRHRLRENGRNPGLLFNGKPHRSVKDLFFPPEETILSSTRDGEVSAAPRSPARNAILGLRACDMRAIEIMDRVFLGGDSPDPWYKAGREDSVLITVDCTRVTGTCFCSSMGTGPSSEGTRFDIRLVEIGGEDHRFVAWHGSKRGKDLLSGIGRGATRIEIGSATRAVRRASRSMKSRIDSDLLRKRSAEAIDSRRWTETAKRCLACGSCTLVCPTCFCSTVIDRFRIDGSAERARSWDSCFTRGHSYIHGGAVRKSRESRYRQWLMHKLVWWHDEFGESGCVGCGRCITWCPAGIDITEEAYAVSRTRKGGKR